MRILEREIVYGMQLLGASNVRELVPEMVSPAVYYPVLEAKRADLALGRTDQLAATLIYVN